MQEDRYWRKARLSQWFGAKWNRQTGKIVVLAWPDKNYELIRANFNALLLYVLNNYLCRKPGFECKTGKEPILR
jgi:hypothetical protein